jgi:hypothetical protein
MAVAAQVHLHAVDIGREISAVVEVEATQEILVGLPAPRMLGRDHAGHGFEQFGNPQQRADQKVRAPDAALAGRLRRADLGLTPPEDHDIARLRISPIGLIPVGRRRDGLPALAGMAASIIAAPATMRSSAPHFITFIIIPPAPATGVGACRHQGGRRASAIGHRWRPSARTDAASTARSSLGRKDSGSGHPLDHSMSDQTQAGLLAHGSRQRCMAFPGLA